MSYIIHTRNLQIWSISHVNIFFSLISGKQITQPCFLCLQQLVPIFLDYTKAITVFHRYVNFALKIYYILWKAFEGCKTLIIKYPKTCSISKMEKINILRVITCIPNFPNVLEPNIGFVSDGLGLFRCWVKFVMSSIHAWG